MWVWDLNHRDQLGPIPVFPDAPKFNNLPVRWDASVCGGAPVVMRRCRQARELADAAAGRAGWQTCGVAPWHSLAFMSGTLARLGSEHCVYHLVSHDMLELVVRSGRAPVGAYERMG